MAFVSQVCQDCLSHSGDGYCVHFLLLASAAYSCQEGLFGRRHGGMEDNVPEVRMEIRPLVTVSGTQ